MKLMDELAAAAPPLVYPPMSSIAKQTEHGRVKNTAFFRDRLEEYRGSVNTLDTYRNIRSGINKELQGMGRLLDVGNGGTFDYDISLVRELVAVDLFLEDLPDGALPPTVQAKNGSALELPFPDESFDGVLMVMLLHHLIWALRRGDPAERPAGHHRGIPHAFTRREANYRGILRSSVVLPFRKNSLRTRDETDRHITSTSGNAPIPRRNHRRSDREQRHQCGTGAHPLGPLGLAVRFQVSGCPHPRRPVSFFGAQTWPVNTNRQRTRSPSMIKAIW